MRIPRQHDAIADAEVRNIGADRNDLAGRFMTEHRGQFYGKLALDRLEVGMAQARRADPHQHIAGRERPTSIVSIVIGVLVCRSTAARACTTRA